MEPPSSELSTIFCNRCKSFLVHKIHENGFTKYQCKCSSSVRVLLTCVNCKKQFLNLPYLIRKTNYCSRQCYWVGTNRKQLRICQSCGKDFQADAVLIKKGYGFYCTRDCWFKLFHKERVKLICNHCRKNFYVPLSVSKHEPRFCNKKCKDDFERDYVSRICRGCKRGFELPRSDVNRGRGSFCAWKCYKKYRGETSIEMIVRLQLEKMQEPFKQEFRIGKFTADFFLPARNLIIECDGKYWHNTADIKNRDKRKDQLLKSKGYKVVRLKEDGIKMDAKGLISSILN